MIVSPSNVAEEEEGTPGAGSTLTVRLSSLAGRLLADPRLHRLMIMRPHPLLLTVRREGRFVLLTPAVVWDRGRELLRPFAACLASGQAMLILLGGSADPDLGRALDRGLAAVVSAEPDPSELVVALHNAFALMDEKAQSERRGRWLSRYRYELGELIEIARAITKEREIDRLLDLILEKSRFITGADAGSIYVIEGDDPDPSRRTLRFKLSQNASVVFDSREFTIPVSARSMSGYVALHRQALNIEQVYNLPKEAPYGFDRSFDEKTGYKSQSMLCAPLLSRKGEAIGVIQLINKKRDPKRALLLAEDIAEQVLPFDTRSEELLSMLASQAGIALENAILYAEIQHMLEGFVRASVEAIEQRDPTTSGHSRRVSDLTLALACAIERADTGPYRGVTFTRDDLRELEYASLLHDFGKIGVREQVLLKQKKLFDHELEIIRSRFAVAIRGLEVDILSRKLRLVERRAPREEVEALEREFTARRAELEASFETICLANEPTVLKSGDFERIEALGRETYIDVGGDVAPLLRPVEIASLSVSRGSLTPAEIDEIRSHVSHTYEFLSRIPWGKQFRRVAAIAGAHHEHLNGKGYPNGLRAEEIPLQSKMMSVSDIFDALTASDRPYKKAVPLDKAIEILGYEVSDQHLDPELVRIFVDAKVWTCLRECPRNERRRGAFPL